MRFDLSRGARGKNLWEADSRKQNALKPPFLWQNIFRAFLFSQKRV
jgi:hypothetical protein